jgi:prevent-host-death family protein
MEQRISAWQARRQFGKLLRDVSLGKAIVVESHGEEVAAVVPIDQYRRWEQDREADFGQLRGMARQANLSEHEARILAEEAVAAAREHRP